MRIKTLIPKFLSLLLVFSLIGVSFPASLYATAITSAKDTMTRIEVSTTADHTIVFTLPTGIDIDRAGNVDTLRVDFPHSSAFTQSGTWATGDFTFNDGTARTISAVSQGNGTIDCTPTGGANDVCVAIDTTNHIFTIEVGASYTASGTAPTVTFTIDGTTADGTLTNPSSANSYSTTIEMCDETASCTSSFTQSHLATISQAIIDDDTVAVSATVSSSLTFDLDTAAGGGDGESSAPYTVALGTIPVGSVRVSGSTDSVQMVVVEADTNGAGGVLVTVQNANGASGLVSTSVGADDIDSADGTMAAGTENYGLCVDDDGPDLTGFTIGGGFSGDACDADSETNVIEGLSTTAATILSTSAPVSGAHAEVIVNAAISTTTVAHDDYTDTITFIGTATF